MSSILIVKLYNYRIQILFCALVLASFQSTFAWRHTIIDWTEYVRTRHLASRRARQTRLRSSEKAEVVMETKVVRHMGVGEGLEEEGNGNAISNGGAGKAKISMVRCFRCRAAGHYSESCTATTCEPCGGRGHQIDMCASPADMDQSPAEAALAIVEDLEDDAEEAAAF